MLVMDNSDFMRNGDFAPSRLEAQQDAVNLLAGAKTQSNPENKYAYREKTLSQRPLRRSV